MLDFFQREGKVPVLTERLKILVRDGEICIAVSFSILAEMPSDPLAFVTSRDIKNSLTSVSVHRMSSGHSPTREGSRRSMTSRAGYDLLKHVEKKLFDMFVMSVEVVTLL